MQTRTPPALKWLLVERVTLMGDLQRIQQRQQQLAKEASQLQAKLQALDETLHLTESRVNPTAAGSVRRHCPKYGYRGVLKDFVVQVTHESDNPLIFSALRSSDIMALLDLVRNLAFFSRRAALRRLH